MQKKSLIPTPLNPDQQPRKPIELVEPSAPARFRSISITLFLMGMGLRLLVGRMGARLGSRWAKDRFGPAMQARRLRAFMERMGGLWVKAGQIVALRRDLFTEAFCAELSKLQDRARGFPGQYSRRIIEQELGKPLAQVFAEFDEVPLAAASIGQAHRARLRAGNQAVVVKVQRPDISEIIIRDLSYLKLLTRLLGSLRIALNFRWDDIYWEIERALLEELDYHQEAVSLKRMRKNLRKQKIYVPKPYLELCTGRILVMEMVHGVSMSEYIHVAVNDPQRAQSWLAENQILPRRAGERLLFSHYQQLLEDNLYHCDLHPGNILLMRKSRITLIDFGSVGNTDQSQLQKILLLWSAVTSGDYEKVAELFLLLAPSIPNRDLTEPKQQVVRFYREFETLSKIESIPYHEKSVGRVTGQVVRILSEAGVTAGWDLLRSSRAGVTLDASLMFLLPDINYLQMMGKYLNAMRARQQKKLRAPSSVRAQLARLPEFLAMPVKFAENTYFEGEYFRRRAFKYEGSLSSAAKVGGNILRALSGVLRLVALLAAVAYLHQRYQVFRGLPASWVTGLLGRLPRVEPLGWILSGLAALYISRKIALLKRTLDQPDPSHPSEERR